MENLRLIDFRLRPVFDNKETFDEIEVASSSISFNWLEHGLIATIELRSLAQLDFWRGVDVNGE